MKNASDVNDDVILCITDDDAQIPTDTPRAGDDG